MKVFVAGATGAVGKRLVPLLVAHGHEVTGMTRSSSKTEQLRALGAEPVVADGLDQAAVRGAVDKTEPEIVIHQMTALAGARSFLGSTVSSRSRTGCEPRAQITCWPRPEASAFDGS